MSELASYSIQAVFFALVAVVAVSRSNKTDLYQFALVSIWLIGVVAIFARYGEDQVLFYSNDQQFHQLVIEYYIPVEGFHLNAIISLRYLLTAPVYLVSLLGFSSMLTLKFLQLIFLLLLYRRTKRYLLALGVQIKYWQLPLLAGPIMIFMSTLALRDIALAYFTFLFISSKSLNQLIIGFSGAILLRPHLGAALIIGIIVSRLVFRLQPKLTLLSISFTSLFSYVLGSFASSIGKVLQNGLTYENPKLVFSQIKFSQLAANFVGLQFLIIDDPKKLLVAASASTLLLSRIIFFDTLFIPLLFLVSVYRHPQYLIRQKMMTLQAFIFFYGVVSQTTWNSTRQNIPFLACMGVLAVADIEHFRKVKAKVVPKLLMATR
jgi:hypothetical protein